MLNEMERSELEYEKYRELQVEMQKESSLKEIEDDIKKLGKSKQG